MLKPPRLITLLAILFIVSGSHSQNKTNDSLESMLKAYSKQDTIRVNLMNSVAAKIKAINSGKAVKLLTESEKLAAVLNYHKGEMESLLQLGKIYCAIKQYEKAIPYVNQGAAIANKLNHTGYKKQFYLLNSELNYDKYLVNRKTTEAYLIKASRNITLVTKLEKYLYIVGFVVLVILFVFIMTSGNIKKLKIQNKQLLTEQKLRRSQMNPHFIFNSIQSIRSLINNKQEAEAIDYINKFAALTRQILESSDESYTSLTEEIEIIENYITLQQLLYTNKFSYTITVDEAIDTDALFLPSMLSQPFIENALKHGLSTKAENGLLKIRFYMKKKSLIFEVTDNGSGFGSSKKQDNHKSMAMEITRNRLVHYTKNVDFVVQADNIIDAYKNIVGARISFEIPYIYEN